MNQEDKLMTAVVSSFFLLGIAIIGLAVSCCHVPYGVTDEANSKSYKDTITALRVVDSYDIRELTKSYGEPNPSLIGFLFPIVTISTIPLLWSIYYFDFWFNKIYPEILLNKQKIANAKAYKIKKEADALSNLYAPNADPKKEKNWDDVQYTTN